MIAKDLIVKVRKTKGPIFVEATSFTDMFWVQAVKSDLLFKLSWFDADDETGFTIDHRGDQGFFGKDYMSR